jgi:hypothetical protein
MIISVDTEKGISYFEPGNQSFNLSVMHDCRFGSLICSYLCSPVKLFQTVEVQCDCYCILSILKFILIPVGETPHCFTWGPVRSFFRSEKGEEEKERKGRQKLFLQLPTSTHHCIRPAHKLCSDQNITCKPDSRIGSI